MEWSLDAIASSLQLEFEEGYNDRYTFTLTNNKLSVDDLHLMVNVCTIEPYSEGYILHPHEETVDSIVLDGTSESPWSLANHFVDLYDTEHPVLQEKYIAYLEHKVEQLEASLSDKQSELVAMDILKTNKDTEIASLKEENARLVSELNRLVMRHFIKVDRAASNTFGGEYIDIADISAFTKSRIFLKNGIHFECDVNLYNCLVEIFQNKPVENIHIIETSCPCLVGYYISCEYINGVKKPWNKNKEDNREN